MKKTYFKLEQVIDELGSSKNHLANVSDVRPDTIYSICNNTVKRINLSTLNKIMDGLNKISENKGGPKIHLHDIIDYEQ